MAFWNTETLKHRIPAGDLIQPYDVGRVKHAAYELSVGLETYLTSDSTGAKQQLDVGKQVVIPPGQLGLLITEEEVQVPLNALGLISIKAGIKFRGLVNVSGFHVDPGFHGRLKFSVYNAGSQNIVLSRGQPAFLIWFADLDDGTKDRYDGTHQGQTNITADDVMKLQGEIASPGQLKKDIQELQGSVSNIKTLVGILITLIAGLILGALKFLPVASTPAPPPQPPAATQNIPEEPGQTSPPAKSEEQKTNGNLGSPGRQSQSKSLDSQ